MKKIASVCAALMFACGVAVAKDAKRPAAMSDAEMDAVTAGDIQLTVLGKDAAYISTPVLNPVMSKAGFSYTAPIGSSAAVTISGQEGTGKNLGTLGTLIPLPIPTKN